MSQEKSSSAAVDKQAGEAESIEYIPFTLYDNLELLINNYSRDYSITEERRGVYTVSFKREDSTIILTLLVQNPKLTLADIKIYLTNRGESLLGETVEDFLVINDLTRDGELTGFYYTLTEKDLVGKETDSGDFRYLFQGYILYNNLIGDFTFFCNDRESGLFEELNIAEFVQEKKVMSNTQYFEDIKLTEEDIADFNLGITKHFYSKQQSTFYNNTQMHESIIGPLKEKYTQELGSGDEEGTIFYYYFEENLEAGSEGFLRGLFYGSTEQPTKTNPELLLIKDNYLVVFSFPFESETAKEYYDIVKDKVEQ